MKRKAKKQAGRKQRVLTEAELKKIAAGGIPLIDRVERQYNKNTSTPTRWAISKLFG